MKPIIKVENISKQYRIGAREEGYATLRETLVGAFRAPLKRLRSIGQVSGNESVWALKDVSFEVHLGEVVGIIGRNGAGKSTLLKVLSRITRPTAGKIDLYGRVGSLLEVGTGFHPELTGRENVFLNGAILGMRRQEIERRFDEIVAFAEIDRFLDTPVKRYSSGMYVRLAFAVAAHLEPEILIVDEVLAVGDAAFQKKCLGKMGDAAKSGRTVLLVSHNMIAIRQLCHKCLWIDQGELRKIGPVQEVVGAYSLTHSRATEGEFAPNMVKGDGRVQLISYRATNDLGRSHPLPVTNEDVLIHIGLRVAETIREPACGISITNEHGVLMTSINTVEQGSILAPFPSGEVKLVVKLSQVAFLPGSYMASFWIMNPQGHIYAMADKAIPFEIGEGPLYGTRQIDHRPGWGCVYTKVDFFPEAEIDICD